MRLLKYLEKQKNTWFLIGISFLFFLLRLPSLFEPLWYGDEGIYEVIGKALRSGRLLYRDIWDNKPPLLYYIYALVNGDQFGAKLLSLLVGIATIIAFFFLAKKLLSGRKSLYTATILFTLLFGLPILEGNIANAENFMLLPIILAGLLIIHKAQTFKKSQRTQLFLAGLLLGIAFLIKIVALFDAAAFGTIIFIVYSSGFMVHRKNTMNNERFTMNQLSKLFNSLISLYTGFIIPVIITIFYFGVHGALHDFIVSTFSSNIGYVGYANAIILPGGKIIPQGILILKLFFLGAAIYTLFYKRQAFSLSSLFIYIWLAFSLFNMFFSQRPYTHYSLVLIPSLCLLTGYASREHSKKIWHSIIAILCVIAVIFQFNLNIGSLGKSLGYYKNFTDFLARKINVDAYYNFFDPAVVRDKQLAQFITMHKLPSERIFIWGNSGQLYILTNELPLGKYIVAYHMTLNNAALSETQSVLNKIRPTYIIILPNQPTLPYDLKNYLQRFSIDGATIYEKYY